MCDYHWDDGDRCNLWFVTKPTARKAYVCEECYHPIYRGQKHDHIKCMYEGYWGQYRVHSDCHILRRRVDLDVCRSKAYVLGVEVLMGSLQEHYHIEPDLKREYKNLVERRRKERLRYATVAS